MKITRVEPIFLEIPYEHGGPKPARASFGVWHAQPMLLLRVETDAGITGWGEAFSHTSTPVTMTAVTQIVAKLAVGREASDIAALMFELTRRTMSIARGGPVQFALSGLDIALWDIAGKATGQPVWRLLGAPESRLRIPVYASLFRLNQPEDVARVAARAVERGYRGVKLHEHTVPAVAAARAGIGPGISLMVDTNCSWDDPDEIIAVCRGLEPYAVEWLEEPLYPADAYDVMARIRRQVRVRLAAGENLGNFNDARWIVEAQAVDVVQPSAAKIGGITELRKAMAHIAAHGIRAVPHSPLLGPSLIATLHVIAAAPTELLCEHRFCDLEASPLGDVVVARDGTLTVPSGPGLGFEVDEGLIERYRVR